MVPLVLAVLLSYCLSPVVDLAERKLGMPHGCARPPPRRARHTAFKRASKATLQLSATSRPLRAAARL